MNQSPQSQLPLALTAPSESLLNDAKSQAKSMFHEGCIAQRKQDETLMLEEQKKNANLEKEKRQLSSLAKKLLEAEAAERKARDQKEAALKSIATVLAKK